MQTLVSETNLGSVLATPAIALTIDPLVRELPADLETPISVYLKLAGDGPSFLLESVAGGEQLARYSFIGVHPSRLYVMRGRQVDVHRLDEAEPQVQKLHLDSYQDALDTLRRALAVRCMSVLPGLPRFTGGLVGYMGYEMVRFFEPCLGLQPRLDMPDGIFMQMDILVAFDHAFGKIVLIGNPLSGDAASIAQMQARLDKVERHLRLPLPEAKPVLADDVAPVMPGTVTSNLGQADFCQIVRQAQEHIAAGELFQVVLSQRQSRRTGAAPFDIYRALRRLNPSPYLFYLDFGSLATREPLRLIGASPEVHASLQGRTAAVRPIAGTRRRGKTPAEEAGLEQELLADPKERAEHVMLVDLGRNDLGRICRYGSVQVREQMVVERYSHVIHMVSHVEGELRPEYDAFDLLRATFPAGTVSGAPKIRAMQIIDELEPEGRGAYAGAVGYFSYDGNMDTCIAIRTLVMQGQTVTLQAGAGIVADSIPEKEYQETLNKLRALAVAVDMAEERK